MRRRSVGPRPSKQTDDFKSRHVKLKKKKKEEGGKNATFATFAQFAHMDDHLGFDFFFLHLIYSFWFDQSDFLWKFFFPRWKMRCELETNWLFDWI